MATKKAVEKTEEVETGDSPLIDMNNRQVKRMIKSAKEVGFVTYDALNAVLPPEEFTSEQIEDIMSMLSEMGITVVENDGTDDNDDDTSAANDDNEAEAGEGAAETAIAKTNKESAGTDRTDDPVRMYLREMGSVELLSREGEIAIAKRIEAGRETMIAGLCESPLTFQAIIIWRDELNEGKVLLRDIIDLDATFAGPEAKKIDRSAEGAAPPPSGLALDRTRIEAVMADLRVDPEMAGEFHYQSANTALLGLMLERVYDMPLPELLSSLIWKPAGAADAWWRRYPAGEGVSAYCCLYARPLDWVRVGRFLLDNGTPGSPFLPEALWRDLLLPDLAPQARRQGVYGDQVRHDVLDRPDAALHGAFAYFSGLDGQTVYFLPAQDAVVVRFGARMQLLHSTLYELFPDG